MVVCGICGGSGSGKTTLTNHVLERVEGREVSVLAFDAYYRDLSHLPLEERHRLNFDHPDSLDDELFVHHLDLLRSGVDVDVPEYDFATHTMTGRFCRVAAAPLLLVEGILLLAFPAVRQRLDYCVFLDAPSDVRLERRMKRDIVERGREPKTVKRQFAATVAPMHAQFVEPYRDLSDLIVNNQTHGFATVRRLAADILALNLTRPKATVSRSKATPL